MILLIKYNKTFHKAIKIKPTDVKRDSYSDQNVDSNEKDPKFKIGDHVRLLRYKNIFAKGYAPNWSEKVFIINKIKKETVTWTYVISDLNGEEIVWKKVFMKKNCRRQIKKNLE